MRTTINLDDALLAEAKQVAARTGRSLTAVVEDALRQSLYRRDPATRQAVELPVFGEGIRFSTTKETGNMIARQNRAVDSGAAGRGWRGRRKRSPQPACSL